MFAFRRFRWVQCSIDALDRCVTRREVRNALHSLPKGLDETYERIFLAIDMETIGGQLARRALIWLVAALRPLRLAEIMEALSINLRTRTLDSDIGPMHKRVLLDVCGSLVTYTERTGIIVLSHSSVKVNLEWIVSCVLATELLLGVPHRQIHAHQTITVPYQLGTCTLTCSAIMHVLYVYMPQTCSGTSTSRRLQ